MDEWQIETFDTNGSTHTFSRGYTLFSFMNELAHIPAGTRYCVYMRAENGHTWQVGTFLTAAV